MYLNLIDKLVLKVIGKIRFRDQKRLPAADPKVLAAEREEVRLREEAKILKVQRIREEKLAKKKLIQEAKDREEARIREEKLTRDLLLSTGARQLDID